MSEEKIRVVKDIDVWLIVGTLCVLGLALCLQVVNLVSLGRNTGQLRADAKIAIETRDAACQFRQNLVDQVKESTHYLELHPEGAPALHVSAASIRQTIARQQASVAALAELQCPRRQQ